MVHGWVHGLVYLYINFIYLFIIFISFAQNITFGHAPLSEGNQMAQTEECDLV